MRPSGHVKNSILRSRVKLSRQKMSSDPFLCDQSGTCSSLLLQTFHQSWVFFTTPQSSNCLKSAYFYRNRSTVTENRCSGLEKYVSAYTTFAQELFLSLGFLVSIHSNSTKTTSTAREQSICPSSCVCTLQANFFFPLHTLKNTHTNRAPDSPSVRRHSSDCL